MNKPKRDATQAVMTATLHKDLLAIMDEYCAGQDITRSKFLREAICMRLQTVGIEIASDLLKAPSRLSFHVSHGQGASHGDGAIIHNHNAVATPVGGNPGK